VSCEREEEEVVERLPFLLSPSSPLVSSRLGVNIRVNKPFKLDDLRLGNKVLIIGELKV
jgi:hypothetical protein